MNCIPSCVTRHWQRAGREKGGRNRAAILKEWTAQGCKPVVLAKQMGSALFRMAVEVGQKLIIIMSFWIGPSGCTVMLKVSSNQSYLLVVKYKWLSFAFYSFSCFMMSNQLKSRIQCGFLGHFSHHICYTVKKQYEWQTMQQVLGQKNVQKTRFEAAELIVDPWNQQGSLLNRGVTA